MMQTHVARQRTLTLAIILLVLALLGGLLAGSLQRASAQSAWAPGVSYSVGTLVTYGGSIYKCLQSHTSQAGWEPPNVPALWQIQSGTAPTNTRTRTNTTGTGASPTRTRTRTNTSGTGASPTRTRTRTNTALGGATATRTRTRTNTGVVTGDYSQGVTSLNSSQARIWFRPTNASSLVDLHYLVSGMGQQNFRMSNNAGTWEHTVSGLSSGSVIEYWFTYEKSGPLYVTQHFMYTHNGTGATATRTRTNTSSTGPSPTRTRTNTSGPSPTPVPPGSCTSTGPTGTYPLCLVNNTGGRWSSSQIYLTILGMPVPGEWHYLRADGSAAHINYADESAPNHLTKNGRNYANMSFTIAQAPKVTMPTKWEGGRIYISLGSPMYIPISPDNRGWGGPDLANPNDPNADVYYDWYEFTFEYGRIPFGGNTTQVDQFGFPMTVRLQQASTGYDQTVGINLTRAQVFSQYSTSVASAFHGLANTYRIVAPRSSPAWTQPGGAQHNYMQGYIDQTWSHYTANQFTLTRLAETFSGRVGGDGRLQFTKNGAGPFYLRKPTTRDVVECSGALASAGMSTIELQLGAEFCAAFNRGVAMNPSVWWGSAANYYQSSIKNDFAGFFHRIGIDGRAYGFAYDDINDQSTVKILSNPNPPSALTLRIGW